ncbi:MAG: hydrogenase maturation protease [Truepera sp.]|nr:hydrogenase maturation protease [Truepera sp.]
MNEPHTLILGLGNPLRADDSFGWRLADELAKAELPVGVEVIAYHQLTPELAEMLRGVALVIFLDVEIGVPPGVVRSVPVTPALRQAQDNATSAEAFSHQLNPAALLALTRQLYGQAPAAYAVSVGAADLGYGTALSDTVEAALPEALEAVVALLRRIT